MITITSLACGSCVSSDTGTCVSVNSVCTCRTMLTRSTGAFVNICKIMKHIYCLYYHTFVILLSCRHMLCVCLQYTGGTTDRVISESRYNVARPYYARSGRRDRIMPDPLYVTQYSHAVGGRWWNQCRKSWPCNVAGVLINTLNAIKLTYFILLYIIPAKRQWQWRLVIFKNKTAVSNTRRHNIVDIDVW